MIKQLTVLWIAIGIAAVALIYGLATEPVEGRERQERQERRESWSGKDMHPRPRQERQERQDRTPTPVPAPTPTEETPFIPTDPSGNPVIYDEPEEGKDKG